MNFGRCPLVQLYTSIRCLKKYKENCLTWFLAPAPASEKIAPASGARTKIPVTWVKIHILVLDYDYLNNFSKSRFFKIFKMCHSILIYCRKKPTTKNVLFAEFFAHLKKEHIHRTLFCTNWRVGFRSILISDSDFLFLGREGGRRVRTSS